MYLRNTLSLNRKHFKYNYHIFKYFIYLLFFLRAGSNKRKSLCGEASLSLNFRIEKSTTTKKTLVLNNIINIEQIILPNPTPVLLFWFESTALKVLGRFGKWKKRKNTWSAVMQKDFLPSDWTKELQTRFQFGAASAEPL